MTIKKCNLIHTLYVDSDKDVLRYSFGWASPEYHLMGWAFSCLQLQKLYGDVILHANSPAASLLIDTLQLPYTAVNVTHDKLTLIHPDLWALAKIYTYSLQEQPFLHIDCDVFLFKPFNNRLLNGELIAQNVELQTEIHTACQKEMMRYLVFFPPCVSEEFKSGLPVLACNAGILGGNNFLFFHDYADLAFNYVNKNANNLKHINYSIFNVFCEQHLFYALAREKNIPVSVMFDGIFKDNGYTNMGDFYDVPFNRSYLHMQGDFKRDELTCIRMAAKFRELYPDHYERIVALFHNRNIRLSSACFINKNRPSIQTSEKDNSHLQRLKYAEKHFLPLDSEKDTFRSDFKIFYDQLISILIDKKMSIEQIFQRDLESQRWYRDLFSEPSAILNQVITGCQEIKVIESMFDWAGLFNKTYRVGVEYYAGIQVKKGHFLNLVVFEASDNGFSLYDINKLEHALLLLLTESLQVSEVLNKMQVYFDDDVIQNHFEAYKELILTSIKQLVIKKTLRPVSMIEFDISD